MKIKIGDRVQVKPYSCSGTITKVEWQEELKLNANGFSIPEGYVYWVKLDDKHLKPRGFSDQCLQLIHN